MTSELRTLPVIVEDIALLLKESVARIEASIPTTQNHYGDYMRLMTEFVDDKTSRSILALALAQAGANPAGVAAALRVLT